MNSKCPCVFVVDVQLQRPASVTIWMLADILEILEILENHSRPFTRLSSGSPDIQPCGFRVANCCWKILKLTISSWAILNSVLSLGATCHIRNECPWSLTPMFHKQQTAQDHAHSRCAGKNHHHIAHQACGRTAKCREGGRYDGFTKKSPP